MNNPISVWVSDFLLIFILVRSGRCFGLGEFYWEMFVRVFARCCKKSMSFYW